MIKHNNIIRHCIKNILLEVIERKKDYKEPVSIDDLLEVEVDEIVQLLLKNDDMNMDFIIESSHKEIDSLMTLVCKSFDYQHSSERTGASRDIMTHLQDMALNWYRKDIDDLLSWYESEVRLELEFDREC